MKLNRILPFLVLFFVVWIVSCTSSKDITFEKQMELKIIDSLSNEMDSALNLINIDADEINIRYTEMDSNIRYLKMGVDSMPDAQSKDIAIYYAGIGKSYEKFLEEYAEMVKETEVTLNRLKTLKKSVELGEYEGEKEMFKEHRSEIEKEINEIIKSANTYIQNLHNVEAGYQRVSGEIEKLIAKLKKR